MRHREVCLICATVMLAVAGFGCGAKKFPWTKAAVIEREPGVEELAAYPRDGQAVQVNPPGFTWTPNEKATAYRLEVRSASESSSGILATEPQPSTVFAAAHPFKPGDYVWQVVYLDGSGAVAGASKARRFNLAAGLTPLVMPDVSRLKRQLAGVRPRMFLSGKRLAEIQGAAASGNLPRWKAFLDAADASLAEEPYAEPAGYPSAEFNVDEWRRIYTPAKAGSSHMARVALAYRVTGDKKYLEAARRWMLAFANWNPRGITSHKVRQPNGSEGNDEASMPILDRMSLAWDWAGDPLTPGEKAKVLAAMTERGNQVLELLKRIDFLTHPFSNHEGRVLAFLGNAGVSFLGDIPDAEKWLDYVLRCYLTSYPGWGGDEGGWAQGLSYWGGYVNYHTGFAEALRGVTEVDLFRRPFYRNTGYLAVYCIPPYAERGAFGDGSDRGPGASQRSILERLSEAFDDPVLQWAAQSIPAQGRGTTQRGVPAQFGIENVGAVLRIRPADAGEPKTESPATLDGSRFFTDIGWVAMHSALGDAGEDVWALFKSSRFGSFSHSHADQNTFQLNAYGRALLIDSGYYPWYGSPHDQLWTRQTRAHNGVLVNGRGQPPFAWAANGTIEEYIRQGPVTMARGQAAKAYNVPQRESVKRQWGEWLKEPIPPMEPKVERFERTVAFVASKTRPVFVVQDQLLADAPASFDWLLHAMNQMKVEDGTGVIRVQNGDARLVVRLIATEPLRFSQRDWFTPPPELDEATARTASLAARKERYANQWHLNARTGKPAREVKFAAVMVPYRVSEGEPVIAVQKSVDSVVLTVGGTTVVAWMGDGAQGALAGGGISAKGRLAVRVSEGGKTETVVAQ